MSKFINAINTTYTENGALTNASTGSSLLDYFSMGSALRSRTIEEKYNLFVKASVEDQVLAMKILFYSRDPRGGQGERQTFRDIFTRYAKVNYEVALKLFLLIPEFGRWDDYIHITYDLSQEGYDVNDQILFLSYRLFSDKEILFNGAEGSASLLAKWMPSINTSSKETRAIANWLVKELGITKADYRKMLSKMRKKINVVEQQMSANKWPEINYEHVPSQASRIYRNAFLKHDYRGYSKFLVDVNEGKAKINTSVTYPYEIVRNVMSSSSRDETLETLWKNLPDYTEGREENSIVVCDTSGSMAGLPIQIAISLSIYFAERNKGEFKNYFITFSEKPQLQKIEGRSLFKKVNNLKAADWDMNTDLQAVFDLILERAKVKNLHYTEMPSKIYIISDMEFDQATSGSYYSPHPATNFEVIEKKYNEYGYAMPELVFWNVNSLNDQSPITVDDKGVKLVSGASPSIFKSLMADETITAYDLMLEVINQERYNAVEEAMNG